MAEIIGFPHGRASSSTSESRFSKTSIGMPVASLNRLANGKDAVFRRARRLRKCDGEQPTRSARADTESAFAIKGSSGWASDIVAIISMRNSESQEQKFLVEMRRPFAVQVKCAMPTALHQRAFLLGEWIDALAGGAGLVRGYQTHMARELGITQGQVSSMIAGRKVPQSAELLLNLSELIGTTVNDLFKSPPPEAYINRLRPYSRFYNLYVGGTPKTSLRGSKAQSRLRA